MMLIIKISPIQGLFATDVCANFEVTSHVISKIWPDKNLDIVP